MKCARNNLNYSTSKLRHVRQDMTVSIRLISILLSFTESFNQSIYKSQAHEQVLPPDFSLWKCKIGGLIDKFAIHLSNFNSLSNDMKTCIQVKRLIISLIIQ